MKKKILILSQVIAFSAIALLFFNANDCTGRACFVLDASICPFIIL